MCSPYDSVITASTGAVAPMVSGTDGFSSTTSKVRYTAAARPTTTELLSIRRYRIVRWYPTTCHPMSIYKALRPALFALDAERAHDLMMTALAAPPVQRTLSLAPRAAAPGSLRQLAFGVTFDNPIGLAAGLDKQGTAVPAWAALGFGFAEVGTVTPRPQPGNPKPRLFRLPGDRAIINRFGFNSVGAAGVARNLAANRPADVRIGINVGRNKDTPNDRAADDYTAAVDALRQFADYFVVNVSSPNTSGLRDLQEGRMLRSLLEQ